MSFLFNNGVVIRSGVLEAVVDLGGRDGGDASGEDLFFSLKISLNFGEDHFFFFFLEIT